MTGMDVHSTEGLATYWWDDAIKFAQDLAVQTGMRHRVFLGRYGWTVAPVIKARHLTLVPA